jgi:mRNA interferase MazF
MKCWAFMVKYPKPIMETSMHQKDFKGWNRLKIQLQEQHSSPTFQQREVWWCSVGVNLGNEIDGKNQFYNRPVLVIRKFNRFVFYGVPLSTKLKEGNPYYFPIHFKDKSVSALIAQMRLFDSRRLTDPMGKLSQDQFLAVREAIKRLV